MTRPQRPVAGRPAARARRRPRARSSIVGDRPADMRAALGFAGAPRASTLIVTSGGLGPTADDLTAEVVGELPGPRDGRSTRRCEARIAEILERLAKRWPNLDLEAIERGKRKQATIPRGRHGARAGRNGAGARRAAGRRRGGPTVVVLPGPPRELQPMWSAARGDRRASAPRSSGRDEYRAGDAAPVRHPGVRDRRDAARRPSARASTSTRSRSRPACARGEIEIVTRYEPRRRPPTTRFAAVVRERHADTLFSRRRHRRSTSRSRRCCARPARTVATAESCTGGLLAARLTDLPGSSAYVARRPRRLLRTRPRPTLAGVDPALIEQHGAVSLEVAEALADGAIARFGADVGVGVTGIAGPDGGTRGEAGRARLLLRRAGAAARGSTARAQLPGGRADVRDRATTVALHLLRRLLLGLGDLRRDRAGRPSAGAALRRAGAAGRRPRTALAALGPARRQPPIRALRRAWRGRAARHVHFLGGRPRSRSRGRAGACATARAGAVSPLAAAGGAVARAAPPARADARGEDADRRADRALQARWRPALEAASPAWRREPRAFAPARHRRPRAARGRARVPGAAPAPPERVATPPRSRLDALALSAAGARLRGRSSRLVPRCRGASRRADGAPATACASTVAVSEPQTAAGRA